MNRTSGSPKKASLVVFHDCRTGALGCSEGGIMMFDHCSPAELFMAKRKGGAAAAVIVALRQQRLSPWARREPSSRSRRF
jgi:hypothetical protein